MFIVFIVNDSPLPLSQTIMSRHTQLVITVEPLQSWVSHFGSASYCFGQCCRF